MPEYELEIVGSHLECDISDLAYMDGVDGLSDGSVRQSYGDVITKLRAQLL